MHLFRSSACPPESFDHTALLTVRKRRILVQLVFHFSFLSARERRDLAEKETSLPWSPRHSETLSLRQAWDSPAARFFLGFLVWRFVVALFLLFLVLHSHRFSDVLVGRVVRLVMGMMAGFRIVAFAVMRR